MFSVNLYELSSLTSKNYVFSTFILTGALSLFQVSHANNGLEMSLQANKVVLQPNGETRYIPVSTAKPGTVIQYKAHYTNLKDRPIYNLMVTLPIPEGMTFTGTAYPPSAQASVDGNNFIDMPLMRREGSKLVKVPYSEYNSLRWNIKYLPISKTATVSLNALVE